MAEQDDATILGNIELAIQSALFRVRTATVASVLAYREVGPHGAPVVDVQILPELLARPVDGQASAAKPIAPYRNVPLGFFQAGTFTMRAQPAKGQFVLLIILDRDVDTFMRGDGSTYRPAIPGMIHDLNDAIAYPILMPESLQPAVKPGINELYIGDKTGKLCSIVLDSGTGNVTVKGAGTVTVEAPAVTLGSTGAPVSIARIGDQIIIPIGSSAGTYPIVPGIAHAVTPSAHTVKG